MGDQPSKLHDTLIGKLNIQPVVTASIPTTAKRKH
jgi:hypothetical protein